MRITVALSFEEGAAVRLLNWLARENALIMRSDPAVPLLYTTSIIYLRETEELWSDAYATLAQGHEDCDALSAYRCGELLAHGWKALNPDHGDHGARAARAMRLKSIKAQCVMRTRKDRGYINGGLYHCIVKYEVGGRTYYDDPSARLGMYGYRDLQQPTIEPLPDARIESVRLPAGFSFVHDKGGKTRRQR